MIVGRAGSLVKSVNVVVFGPVLVGENVIVIGADEPGATVSVDGVALN